jgi:ribose 5-phosphate isomerase B
MMKIAVACDHGGFPLKQTVIDAIQAAGHETLDLGTDSTESVDFPDYAVKIANAMKNQGAQRAVYLCGSGVGASIAANKIDGLYASVCHDTYSARQGVEHDNMNVLCIGARIVGEELVKELVSAFLQGQYFNEGRYARRVEKIYRLEKFND